jgi:hypothetical protein
MIFKNIKLGHSCNSSSTHSIVFIQDTLKDKDIDGKFGWNQFIAASSKSKLRYLGAALFDCLTRDLPENISRVIIKNWLGIKVGDDYVDHQSVPVIPLMYDKNFPDEEFINEFAAFLKRQDVAILGDNDNDDEIQYPDLKRFDYPVERYNVVCRKDHKYNFWTLYNRTYGNTIRLSFDENNKITKSSLPELVDIKITDYCDKGCKYCYQNSTTNGLHAGDIHELIYLLAEHKVFEVALGGGEPTYYPGFHNILKSFKDHGITPNFTTRNLDWLYKPERNDIVDNCGAFAYTPSGYMDIDKFAGILTANNIDFKKATIQLVLGTLTEYELENSLRRCNKCHLRVILLGFKKFGRGKNFTPIDYPWWLKVIQKLRSKNEMPEIGIDTHIAAQYKKAILNEGIPDYLFSTQEGKFSMYIDAVNKKIAASSYSENMIDWDYSDYKQQKKFAEIFSTF